MSVKKYPNKLAPGVSPLYEFHGNNRNQGGGGLRMFASRMVRAAGLSGVVAMDGLNRDGFSPLKEKEEEADVNLEPLIKDVSAAMNNKKKSEGDGIGVGERWTAPALRGKKGVGSPDKLMGQKRRPTVVLSALSESLGINNKHLRSKKATKGWWVGLSESLGMFADDEEQHELLNDSDSDDETAGGRGGLLGMFNTDPAVQRARTGYVDDAEREVTTALLAARANVSVVRVIEMANTPTDVTPPPSSHIPPEADRLTRPPIDIPEPPILTSTPLATGIIDSQIDHNPTVTTSGSGGGGGELFTETDDTNQEVSTIGLFAEFDYEVIVKSLDVKTMPNSSSSTKKTIYKGDVVIAVESRNGWLKLSEKGNGVAGNGWLCLHMKKGSSQQQSNNHVGHDDDASSLTGIPPPPAYTSSSASSNSFSFMKKKTGSSSSPSPPKPATSKRKSVFQGAMTAIQSTVNLKSSNDNLYDSDENGDLDEFSKSSNMMNGNNDNYQPTVKLLGEHNSNAVPLKKKKNQRKSVVNFGGVSSQDMTNNKITSSSNLNDTGGGGILSSRDMTTNGRSKWTMPKRVAVVRVSDGIPVEASEDNVMPLIYKPNENNTPDGSGGGGGGGTKGPLLTAPPSLEGLPAVFALHKENNEAALSASAALPGAIMGGTANIGNDDILNDLIPLDIPLPPLPGPAALSLIDMDSLPSHVREQFKRRVMDKSQLEFLLEAARNDPALVAASRAAKERVAEAQKKGMLL